ncbi:LytR/AlgR family response regulator transcription factor [Spirosoma oryzicola]|uniref:LytR/AlgR family response regulator transcription factor n=1 Tax=Spirosoma oryzicola TaxID=2898794 RepID=UPI003CC5B03A
MQTAHTTVHCLAVSVGQLVRYVPASLILRIEGCGNYSWVYTRNGERYLVSKTLSHLELQVPTFWRVHKSHLVNPQYIQDCIASVRRNSLLKLNNNQSVTVARRLKATVCRLLKEKPRTATSLRNLGTGSIVPQSNHEIR